MVERRRYFNISVNNFRLLGRWQSIRKTSDPDECSSLWDSLLISLPVLSLAIFHYI